MLADFPSDRAMTGEAFRRLRADDPNDILLP